MQIRVNGKTEIARRSTMEGAPLHPTRIASGGAASRLRADGCLATMSRAARLLPRRLDSVIVEVACPLFIAGVLLDAVSRVAWNNYVGRDAQIFAAVAALWERGLMPYRDVYDIKPPVIYAALRLAFTLWGHEAEGLRRLALSLAAVGALSLYIGLRRLRLTIAAPITALAFLSLAMGDPTTTAFQFTEPWAACFATLALGFAALHQYSGGWWWATATGAALALGALSKPPVVLYAVPLGLQLSLWGASGRWWWRALYPVTRAAVAGIGFAAVAGAVAAYFAWNDALYALYECVVVDGGANYAGVTLGSMFHPSWWLAIARRPTADLIASAIPWPYLAAVALLVPLTLLRPSRWMVIGWAWTVAGYFAMVVGPRGWSCPGFVDT